MAIALVRDFGRPDDVAARYRPALTIIDPADGRRFVRATLIGLGILWALGLLGGLSQPLASTTDVLRMLGQWWSGTVLASLWWPGALVVAFGLAHWSRQRWPQSAPWKPRDNDRIPGGRTTMAMAVVSIVCGMYVLIDPRWILDTVWQGHAAAAAYDALTYTDTFRHRQAPWLLGALLLNLPLFTAVIIQGRWTPRLRQLELALSPAHLRADAVDSDGWPGVCRRGEQPHGEMHSGGAGGGFAGYGLGAAQIPQRAAHAERRGLACCTEPAEHRAAQKNGAPGAPFFMACRAETCPRDRLTPPRRSPR